MVVLLWERLVSLTVTHQSSLSFFGPSLRYRLLSDKGLGLPKTGSQMSLISILRVVYTLESLSRDCRNTTMCSVRNYWKQTKRENASPELKKSKYSCYMSCAYVAKAQPVWKQTARMRDRLKPDTACDFLRCH